MQSPANPIFLYLVGFTLSAFAAWVYVRATRALRRRVEPSEDSVLVIRSESGIYRARLLSLGKSIWTMSAPLQRDAFVPLRVGERLVLEAPAADGVRVFRSRVVARQNDPHAILLQRPQRIHKIERREHRRWQELRGESARVEGQAGVVIDISEGGARIDSAYRGMKGDRVRIDLPWGETVFGWVLSREGSQSRVRFEELVCAK